MLFGLLRRRREGDDAAKPAAVRKPPYQLRRHPIEKFDIIRPLLERHGVRSVLDVGCNAGVITRLAGQAGYFAVGIDRKVDTFGVSEPLDGACLGEIAFDLEVGDKIPEFDAVLLLSVYHQLVHKLGDPAAQDLLRALARKAVRVLILELPGRAMKCGYGAGEHFTDHHEESVVAYWRGYLATALPAHATAYLGKSREKQTDSEPFRYLFSCLPNR